MDYHFTRFPNVKGGALVEEETGAGLRFLPTFYVLDEAFQTVGCCEGPIFADRLPPNGIRDRDPFAAILQQIARSERDEPQPAYAVRIYQGLVVHAARVSGSFSGYVAWIEPEWWRGAIRDARARSRLSAREYEILDLLVLGLRRSEIARDLGIAETTVQSHIRKIGSKLGCTRRSDIVARALGVLHLPSRLPL
jgi:DNA-binding CsgD family transcriptional regulator